ncbi:hypothetical protein EG68_06349 [Paragonimus skrjabini miyazakii]|uniref:Secreted protein n=1 Tax=Paragonimus skrjabini miyazakii TaxID=59628 RepID=A0A8S9YRG0_9TREM|nr:hypothetical protein EG68_06349 [Paragonimus skrjabini miyazakii]
MLLLLITLYLSETIPQIFLSMVIHRLFRSTHTRVAQSCSAIYLFSFVGACPRCLSDLPTPFVCLRCRWFFALETVLS